MRGTITDSGVIYCPHDDDRGILKIDTNIDRATVLDGNLFPALGGCMWASCAAALDGCIYFMPSDASRVMKLDPNNNNFGNVTHDNIDCVSGGVLARDGCIYESKTTNNSHCFLRSIIQYLVEL